MLHRSREVPRPGRWIPLLPAALGCGALLAAGVLAAPAHASPGQLVVSLRDTPVTSLGSTLAGSGVTVTDVSFDGVDVQAGTFADLAFGAIAPSTGVVLSTGSVIDADPTSDADVDFTSSSVLGPNTRLTTTGDLGGAGSPALEASFGVTTYDAAVLSLVVVPQGTDLTLEYVFGSEEYAEWSERSFTDAFAIYVGDSICSTVPGTSDPVGTGTVSPAANPELYVANFVGTDPSAGGYDTEMNGFTTSLTCSAEVTPEEPVTVTVAVADTADGHLDSTVLLAAQSLTSTPVVVEPTPTPTTDPPTTDPPTTDPATATADPTTARPTAVAAPGPRRGGGSGGSLPWTGSDPVPAALLTLALVGAGTGTWLVARRLRGLGSAG